MKYEEIDLCKDSIISVVSINGVGSVMYICILIDV